MSQKLTHLGLGIDVDNAFYILHGTGMPGLTEGSLPDDASPGSIYINDSDGTVWRKYLPGVGISKWVETASVDAPIITTGVTTEVVIDEVLVDEIDYIKWIVEAISITNNADKYLGEILAVHNGTLTLDATTTTNNTYSMLKINDNSTLSSLKFTVALTGTGTTQKMQLRASSATSVNMSVARLVSSKITYSAFSGIIDGGQF